MPLRPLNLGLRMAAEESGPSYDADALTAFAAVEATGVTLTTPQKTAANTFIVGLKENSLWTGIDLLYMCIGGTSASHAVNWKTPGTYNITWYNSPTHNANGVQFGGTAHGRTGYNPNTAGVNPANSGLFGYVNSVGSGTRPIIAAQNDPTTLEMLLLHNSINEFHSMQGLYAGRAGTHPSFTTNNCVVGQRNSTTETRRFINGTKTTTSTGGSGTTPVNLALYIGCYNYGGSPLLYSNARLALIGAYRGAWSDAAQTAFAALVNNLQTALSRA